MASEIKSFRVLETLFLVGEEGSLRHVLKVQVDNSGPTIAGHLTADLGGSLQHFGLPQINRGLQHYQVMVPEVREPTAAVFTLAVAGEEYRYQTTLAPVRHWRIYLIPFSHHDLGYTDLPEVCIQQHKDYFNSIIDYCRQTNDFPGEAKFRWTCDTTWAVKFYLQDATDRQTTEFFDLVRDGRIEITAQYAAFNSALLTHEELVRSIYYAHELARQHGFRITSAMTTDIPGNPWGFPQVLAKSGIKYLSTAVNQRWAQDGVPRSKVPRISRPFYWASPDGSEVLVWNSDPELIYTEGRELGCTDTYDKVLASLPGYLRNLEGDGYEYDAIHLRTTTKVSDNAPPCIWMCRIVREWNEKWAYPRLYVATSSQFFRYMEQQHSERFPHYSGDWTDWWMDGPASSAYETGITRVAHEELASAEKLAAIASALDQGQGYPQKEIEQAYDNLMLYDEHTWGMWNNVSDPYLPTTAQEWATKAVFAKDAVRQTHALLDSSLRSLGQHIRTGEAPVIAVFNTLSWPKTGIVQVRIEGNAIDPAKPFQLLTTAGKVVPYQVVEAHAGGSLTIAFLAEDVPSCGYRTYRVLPLPSVEVGAMGLFAPLRAGYAAGRRPVPTQHVLENRFYRVRLDPKAGGIASIWDKELGVELVDPASSYKLNQYVYDSGEPPINGRFSPKVAEIHPGAAGPLWSSLVAISKCRMGKHVRLSEPHWGKGQLAADVTPWIRQEVILYEDIKRIDLVNRLYKEETLEKEGIYFAFPFQVDNGQFSLEVAGAAMRPGIDQLPDSCHDWHNVHYWLDIAGDGYGVTWSSREVPVVSIGDINTGKWQSALALDNTAFFAYAMNNYWTTNFKERQGGDFTFRFSFTSHGPDWDRAQATKFGWSYCTDLLPLILPPGQVGCLGADSGSFCSLDRANVMAFTLKRAEDGDGFIVRLMELIGEATNVRVSFPMASVREAHRTDIVERDLESLRLVGGAVELLMPAFGIETIRVRS